MRSIPYIEDIQEWRSEFSFHIPVNIRFSETDMFGHVNNVSAFIYFEEARVEFLKEVGFFDGSESNGSIPIVADLQCDYHKQIYFNERLLLFVKVNQIGTTSFDVHYLGVNTENELCLTGRGRMVNLDKESGKPVPLTDQVKTKLQHN
ncbi:acyl-CoA thioesterase [Lentibacillus juripiscarius]|uniref:Acyl-CoA thioesterase n=1 Tax=Lentibacillus juripiscarius TaxID=257446 RepID=A0ABW5V0U5_9BACI